MKSMHSWMLAISIFLSTNFLHAEIVIPKIIGNNMVLQCNKTVPIWGIASKDEKITVIFNNQHKQTTADKTGHWMVKLSPMKASFNPSKMIIKGNNDLIQLNNILIGEVWICSGQSNMEYSMRRSCKIQDKAKGKHPTENDILTANNSYIRIFLVRRKYMSPDPNHQGWDSAMGRSLRPFSAVGYFFAKNLYKKLHVPIGMISSAVPGSRIEPWIKASKLNISPKLKNGEILDPLSEDKGNPGEFYTTMIQPLIPFSIRGFLWYQGESNCFLNEDIRYAYKVQTLITSWRHDWKNSKLPFYFVQIAPYIYSAGNDGRGRTVETLPKLWEAQALDLKVPHTGMVTITDLVDNITNLHPNYKWEVGRRLCLVALNKTYGFKNIICSGPTFKSLKIKNHIIDLSFNNVEGELMSRNGDPLTWFSIAGANKKFVRAFAVIKGNNVIVSSPKVKYPYFVRFGWNEAAQSNFINKAGLPAVPFRSDNPWEKLFK